MWLSLLLCLVAHKLNIALLYFSGALYIGHFNLLQQKVKQALSDKGQSIPMKILLLNLIKSRDIFLCGFNDSCILRNTLSFLSDFQQPLLLPQMCN